MATARRTLALACALALVTLVGMSDAPRVAAAPPGRTLFGMNAPSLAQLDASESATGVHAAIVGSYADWAHTPDFPRREAAAVDARGAVAMISWEPWDSWRGGAGQPAYALRRIAGGDHDALIDRWATEIARYRRPVMLRFAPEMNGDWLPWSTGVNGNRAGDYVAAWRHVRARFRRAGAANAVWVWNPIAAYAGSTPLGALFPGAAEVAWLAVAGFNWGDLRAWGWQSPPDIFAPPLRAFATLAPRRPVMIAETAAPPDPRRPAWVGDTLRTARAAGVGAVVWFEFAKETDWRLGGDPASAAAARAVLRGPGWLQGGDRAAVQMALRRR